MSEISREIDEVVRIGLASFMKREGFKKRGRNFFRESEDRVDVLNVQSSRWNSGESGSFTINLGVYLPAIADLSEALPVRGLPKEYECTLRERIGSLMPCNRDYWWAIESGSNLEVIASEIAATVEVHALPWFARMSNMNEVKKELHRYHRSFTSAAIALLQGNREEAGKYLEMACKEQPMAVERIRAWGMKHRLVES
jgi:hypothetical protein